MSDSANRGAMPPWLEDAWLRRYLARELAPDETEWFETYVMQRPHLVAQIDTDSDLRDALHALGGDAARGAVRELEAAPARAVQTPARTGLRGTYAQAAGIAVALIGGLIGGAALTRGPPGSDGGVASIGARLRIEPTRGVAAPTDRRVLATGDLALIEVSVPEAATRFRVVTARGEAPVERVGRRVMFVIDRKAASAGATLVYDVGGAERAMPLDLANLGSVQ